MSSSHKTNFLPVLAGILIGMFVLIPGASLPITLFLFGQYEILLYPLKFKPAEKANRYFLLLLLAGSFLSFCGFLSPISFWLSHATSRVYLYSFILGLTFASLRIIQKKIHFWKLSQFMVLMAGFLFASLALPSLIKEDLSFFSYFKLKAFFSGCALAISFFWPGISFQSALILLGIEPQISLTQGFLILVTGTLLGWFFWQKVFKAIYKKYREKTLSFFLGSILGSLPLIWPFGPFIHYHFIRQQETFPSLDNSQIIICFAFILIGYFPFIKFYKWQKKEKKIFFIPE